MSRHNGAVSVIYVLILEIATFDSLTPAAVLALLVTLPKDTTQELPKYL